VLITDAMDWAAVKGQKTVDWGCGVTMAERRPKNCQHGGVLAPEKLPAQAAAQATRI